MKRLSLIFACLILLSSTLMAQDATQKFAAVGMAFSPVSTPQLQGWGALAIPISEKIISYTDYDVSALLGDPVVGQRFTMPKIQYQMRTGIGILIYKITPAISLWGLGGIGGATDGNATSASFAGGGFLDFGLGRGWGALLILQADRNAATGTQFTPRIGIRKRL